MSLVDRRKNHRRAKSGVLMARLVDPQGRAMHRGLVHSIQYSLYELCEGESPRKRLVSNHIGRQLRVDKVVTNGLKVGGGWDIDASGYNFRHRFVVDDAEVRSKSASTMYELRYVITQTTGERSVVQFRVRLVSDD
jgi:hypothetical protein